MGSGEREDGAPNRLLSGWKQIASHFGKDESTVKRWAGGKGLPVHRVPGRGRGTVYAYSSELEAWLRRHGELSAPVAPAETSAEPAEAIAAAPRRAFPWPVLAACLALVVTGAVLLARSDAGKELIAAYRPVSAAESLYLDGLYHLERRQADSMRRALDLFTEAVSKDPQFAKAYVGLADAYNLLSQYTVLPPTEAYPKAKAAAERAIALDPAEAGAYAALAFNSFYWQRDFGKANELFERAVTLDPDNARAHHWYALTAMHDRRFDLALREISAAQRLDPRAAAILANKGLILFHAGRVEEALAILKPLAETEPRLLSPHAYLATIYLATARYQDFLREYRQAATLSANASALAIADASETAFAGGEPQAMLSAMLAEQKRQYAADREPAFKLALTAAMLGDRGAALDYLDASIKRHEQDILGIRLEPALASLQSEKRYQEMVAEVGFSTE